MLPENPRLGMLGFGEVGYSLAKGFKKAGISQILAYNNGRRNKPPYTQAFRKRAATIDVKLSNSLEEFAANTDLIFSVVIPKESIGVVNSIAPFLFPRHLYLDLNSCSPEAKKEGAAILEKRGVHYVDGVILGTPLQDENRVNIFASGDTAEELRDTMSRYGMNIRVVSSNIGDAALLKMIFSVITKGIQALLWESFLALHKTGLDPSVYKGLKNWINQMGLLEKADMIIGRSAIHARRRAGEMEFAADTLRHLGVEPIMTEAMPRRFNWCANFNFQDHFREGSPPGYKAVFELMDRLSQERKDPA